MKLPFTFSLKFVFRLLFPGIVISLVLFPALKAVCDRLSTEIDSGLIILSGAIFFGWLFIVLDMHIYMLLEGRRYWPDWLRNMFLRLERRRLAKLLTAYQLARDTNRTRYIELSVELRNFPLNGDGEPTVKFPTRLGNLLAAYEEYPSRVYGMDSIFYWYRIWLLVDEDTREHIDSQQALTDSSVYMTFALFITGIITFLYAALQMASITWSDQIPGSGLLVFIGTTSLLVSYFIFRSSLYLHATFGELFKSMFDVHKDKVDVNSAIDSIVNLVGDNSLKFSSSSEKYFSAWRYLHNFKIKTERGVISAAKYVDKS